MIARDKNRRMMIVMYKRVACVLASEAEAIAMKKDIMFIVSLGIMSRPKTGHVNDTVGELILTTESLNRYNYLCPSINYNRYSRRMHS